MENKRKKNPKENKQAKREVGGESTQVSLFWLVLWVNYKNWKVTTKTAMNLIPFSCMLRTFSGDEDIVSPASLLCHCGCHITYRADDPRSFHYKNPLYYPSTSNERTEQTESENTSTKKWKQNWLWVFFSSCHFFWSKEPKVYWPAQKRTLGR